MQIRGLQAQLADARQEQKEQAADKAALQARLQAANDKSAAQDAEKGKLQASGLLLFPAMLLMHNALHCFWSFLLNVSAHVALVLKKKTGPHLLASVQTTGCPSLRVM